LPKAFSKKRVIQEYCLDYPAEYSELPPYAQKTINNWVTYETAVFRTKAYDCNCINVFNGYAGISCC